MKKYTSDEVKFIISFEILSKTIRENADKKGFSMENSHEGITEKIALTICELAEGIEYLRQGNPKSDHIEFSGLEEELADAIIRIMDLSDRLGLRTAEALLEKMQYNLKRKQKHGKLF